MVDRRSLTMRDMALAIGLLAVSLVALLWVMGLLSVGTDTESGATPTADVVGGFDRAGDSLELPLAVPDGLPRSWQATTFLLADPAVQGGDGVLVVRGGWLTAEGRFITLIESPAEAAALVSQEVGQGLGSVGQVDSGGAQWSVYPGQRGEQVWVRTVRGGSVTLLITGSASRADFDTLAAALS